MDDVIVSITPASHNKKTGPIPVTTTSKESCPSTCPLRDAGCYADTGPLNIHWSKTTSGDRGGSWDDLLTFVRKLPRKQIWRHNQAGDLPHTDGKIDAAKVEALTKANRGKRGFTYTHHDPSIPENLSAIAAANEGGFIVNLSVNGLDEVDDTVSIGAGPVVTVLPEDAEPTTHTPNGNRVIVCPAVQREGVTCQTCGLCAKADRKVVIGFPVHGVRKKKAAKSLGFISD